MFTLDKKNKIFLTAGDNAELEVCVFDQSGKEITISDQDKIELTLRQTPNTQVVLRKVADGRTIYFVPSDTTDLDPGLYVYDIQYTNDLGEVNTIIQSFFEIGVEITK